MRFLQIVLGIGSRSGSPDPKHLAIVKQAIDDEIASGKVIAIGGIGKRATAAARVTSSGGVSMVEEPPDGDGWMAGGGYALIDVSSKEEAIARAKSTLEIMGDGVVELIQVTEMYPPPRAPSRSARTEDEPEPVAVPSAKER